MQWSLCKCGCEQGPLVRRSRKRQIELKKAAAAAQQAADREFAVAWQKRLEQLKAEEVSAHHTIQVSLVQKLYPTCQMAKTAQPCSTFSSLTRRELLGCLALCQCNKLQLAWWQIHCSLDRLAASACSLHLTLANLVAAWTSSADMQPALQRHGKVYSCPSGCCKERLPLPDRHHQDRVRLLHLRRSGCICAAGARDQGASGNQQALCGLSAAPD